MASLQNAQIDQSYPGLIKTETNGAIGTGTTKITDGQGNETGMQFYLSGTTRNELGIEAASFPAFYTKNNAFTKANYPMGSGSSKIDFIDAAGLSLSEIKLDNYGSIYYKNINGNQGEGHVFQSATNTGASTPAKIRMDTYNSINNSDNWYLGYQQSVNALTINGQDLTIGRQDATDLTVTLPGGAPGLVAGTGTDSMQSDASLTTTAPSTLGARTVALGNNARANAADTIAIGSGANGEGNTSVSLGINSWAQSGDCIAIGNGAHARLSDCISIGRASQAADNRGIAIGQDAKSAVAVLDAIAFGTSSRANATGAVAIGNSVIAATVNTVSVKALETQIDSTPTSGGIIMSDAGGTDRRINIDATGALQIDSTPVGGGAAGLVNGIGINSLKSADSLAAVVNVASGEKSIAIGNNNEADDYYGIAIGNESAAGNSTIAIGNRANWNTSVDQAVVIGNTSNAATRAVAIGRLANASAVDSFAMGNEAAASATGAAAIGASVTAAIANTASVKALEVQTLDGGIILYSANGTGYKITVTDGGLLQTTAI